MKLHKTFSHFWPFVLVPTFVMMLLCCVAFPSSEDILQSYSIHFHLEDISFLPSLSIQRSELRTELNTFLLSFSVINSFLSIAKRGPFDLIRARTLENPTRIDFCVERKQTSTFCKSQLVSNNFHQVLKVSGSMTNDTKINFLTGLSSKNAKRIRRSFNTFILK